MLSNYINIDIGTDSIYRQSKGNTLPLVQYPFAMQALVLQTDAEKGGWFYNPNVTYAEGIRFSNQPSPWLGDYGHITIMPSDNKHSLTCFERHSSIKKHIFKPDEMEIEFRRYGATINTKPLKYGAEINLNYKSDNCYLIVDLNGNNAEVVSDKYYGLKITTDKDGYGDKFAKYYLFDSSKISSIEVALKNETEYVVITFNDKIVDLNVATSYISFQQAQQNLLINDSATDKWEELLAKFALESDSINKRTYYSNVYRTLLYPHTFHEFDKDNKPCYMNLNTGEVESGFMYVDVGFWDTYRTTMPLLREFLNDEYRQIIEGLLNFYNSYEWLPRWVSPVERGIMPSTLTDSVIAEAIVTNNIDNSKIDLAIEALLKNGQEISENDLHGRRCLNDYIKNGYVSSDDSHESVSMTLDNAYSDYSIYKALEHVGHSQATEYKNRSYNYKHLFNAKSCLFERKDKHGQFDLNFHGDEWGVDYCESSAYQNNFNVPHDVDGLIELFGSRENAIKRLDYIFNAEPSYKVGRYGFEIHEMTEFMKCDLGYFAISNQPSFLLPFFYLKLGETEKFKEVIERTLVYFTENDFPGDEDNGSLSAFYVLVCQGIYPFCPADGEFIKFDKQ